MDNGLSAKTCLPIFSDGKSRPSGSKKKRLRREKHEEKKRKAQAVMTEQWRKEREERKKLKPHVTTITEDLKAQGKWPPKWMQKPEKPKESIPCPNIYNYLYKQLNFNAVFSAKIVAYNSQDGIDYILKHIHANMDFSSLVYYKVGKLTPEETFYCYLQGINTPFQIED